MTQVDAFADPGGVRAGPIAPLLLDHTTILDARGAYWQTRKREWMSLGIQSEIGRADVLAYTVPAGSMSQYLGSQDVGDRTTEGVSVFDPVLCELVYRRWAPPGGVVIDPFAGGSVRGIVAGLLGRRYHGVELRAEQVSANRQQARDILRWMHDGDAGGGRGAPPTWYEGDSRDIVQGLPAADLLFTCPPYGDLERYSDDPRDLSTMAPDAFVCAYRQILAAAVARLHPDSFAALVVGDYRDARGHYRGFVRDTCQAMIDAGCRLHAHAILSTPIGTAAWRVTKQFTAGRKLAKTHQNLLIFVRGDAMRAARGAVGVRLEDRT